MLPVVLKVVGGLAAGTVGLGAIGGAVSGREYSSQATVITWVDGDTVVTTSGKVRLIGVDASDNHRRCYPKAKQATEAAAALAPAGSTITLVNPNSVVDQDKYGRLLAYVQTADSTDVGYQLLREDLANARYDSQDGYDQHPRQDAYRAADHPGDVNDDRSATCLAALATAGLVAFIEDDSHNYPELDVLFDGHHDGDIARAMAAYDAKKANDARIAQAAQAARDAAAKKAEAERLARVAAQKAQADAAAKAAAAKKTAAKRAAASSSSSSKTTTKKKKTSSSTSGGSYPGYTGPRCYAPGGQTWRPC